MLVTSQLFLSCLFKRLCDKDLYELQPFSFYRNVVSIDVSQVVIKQMQEMNREKRPDLVFEQMDATKMTYNDEKFSVVLDKGTLDALMPNSDEATVKLITKYLEVCVA